MKSLLKSTLLITFLFLFSISYSNSKYDKCLNKHESFNNQKQLVQGKVIDKLTKEIIPFCNIVVKGKSIGTSTNELGNFFIEVNTLPAKIKFHSFKL